MGTNEQVLTQHDAGKSRAHGNRAATGARDVRRVPAMAVEPADQDPAQRIRHSAEPTRQLSTARRLRARSSTCRSHYGRFAPTHGSSQLDETCPDIGTRVSRRSGAARRTSPNAPGVTSSSTGLSSAGTGAELELDLLRLAGVEHVDDLGDWSPVVVLGDHCRRVASRASLDALPAGRHHVDRERCWPASISSKNWPPGKMPGIDGTSSSSGTALVSRIDSRDLLGVAGAGSARSRRRRPGSRSSSTRGRR